MNKREQIKEDIISRIKTGSLTPGEKLPSLRALAKQYGVSITPATDACSELVAQGWIESRPCSGFYVSENILNYEISDFKSRMNLNTSERYSMFDTFITNYSDIAFNENNNIEIAFAPTAANSSFYPCSEFNSILAHALRHAPVDLNYYDRLHDSPDLKREITRWMLPCKCSSDADELSIISSGTTAIILALRAVAAPRSTVAIEAPGYVGFMFASKFLDYNVVPVKSNPVTGLDIDDFERIIHSGDKPACLLLTANFSNPTGALMPEENKQRLVELCANEGIPIIEDDAAGELYFGNARPRPLKSFDNDNVIYISGFGKCLTPVARVGYVAAGKYVDELAFSKHLTINYVFPPLQEAMCEFLKSGSAYKHVQFFRSHLKHILENYCGIINAFFPDGTHVRMPGGGLFLWVTLPDSVNVISFAEKARASGISISPGYFFQPKELGFPNCFRINCAAMPWTNEVKNALIKLGSIACQMAQK